ncbi:phosphotransferase enzyme family protein [Paenibacillus sp. NPDC057967]|uniref:phosphotransferase enzyme family protein n=1 Tax=Paenibacillus sp. NPDC057967 TaxID=3346293 RepID=UPI0036D89EB9
MTGMFKMDTQAGIQDTVAQLKIPALRALLHYDLDWESIRFNQLSATCTFKINTTEEGSFLLRLHAGLIKEEIVSEIVWLDFLNKRMNMPLPQGVQARNGASVVRVFQENGTQVYASLMRWVEGEHEYGELSEEQLVQEGVLLAKLHQASQQFEIPASFTRPVWGEHSFRESMEHLEQHYDKFLTEAEFSLYQSAAEMICSRMAGLRAEHEHFGMIHGDLHQGNIVFHQGEPRPIDFGRCGFGYHLYDIAQTILGLHPTQRALVIKGYESIRELGEDWQSKLATFAVMVMIENYSHHAPDPRETEGLKVEQPYAQEILKRYRNGEPFLFQSFQGIYCSDKEGGAGK